MAGASITQRDDNTILVEGDLGAASVPGLLRATRHAFHQGQQLTIDLADVSRADSAGVSLLLDWIRQARNAGADMQYRNAPAQMRDIIHFYALEQVLPLT